MVQSINELIRDAGEMGSLKFLHFVADNNCAGTDKLYSIFIQQQNRKETTTVLMDEILP